MRYLATIDITLEHKVVKAHTITYDNGYNTTKNLQEHIKEECQNAKFISISYEPTNKKIYVTEREHKLYAKDKMKLIQQFTVPRLNFSENLLEDLKPSESLTEGDIYTTISSESIVSVLPISSQFLFYNNLNE